MMPSEEIRVPVSVWSDSFTDLNRLPIELGMHIIFLALAISPLLILYLNRSSSSRIGCLQLALLTGTIICIPWIIFDAASLSPTRRWEIIFYSALCFSACIVAIILVHKTPRRFAIKDYAIHTIAVLSIFGLVWTIGWTLFLGARESRLSEITECRFKMSTLRLALSNAHLAKVLQLDKPPPLNDAHVKGGSEVSWRVTLLPFLELNNLYKKYNFSSPWNTDTNWPLACRKVDTFICPSEPDLMSLQGGRFTSYVMLQNTNKNPENPNLIYDQNRTLLDANRILLIESCGANVVWTEPRDADADTLRWSFKPANRNEEKEPWRSRNIGASSHYGVVQVVFGDGSTRSLSKSIDEEVLRKVILGQASDEELD